MSETLPLGRLNHVAMVVSNLGARERAWRQLLGLPAAAAAPLAAAGVEYVTLEAGGVTLELIEPRAADTDYARFLRQRGEGVHHLCFEVTDIEAWRRSGNAAGLPDASVRETADGRHMIDLGPESFGGVSIQLCQV